MKLNELDFKYYVDDRIKLDWSCGKEDAVGTYRYVKFSFIMFPFRCIILSDTRNCGVNIIKQ